LASVLTPYRSSDGNNPYTEAQLKALWKDLEPESREPGKYTVAEKVLLQREFLKYIVAGFSATRAVSKLQALSVNEPHKWPYADYSTFMAWKAYDPEFAEAYEVAYSMGTDNLEDKGVEMAYGGNASILQFILKMRNPNRYNPKQEVVGDPSRPIEHVHTIKLVAAKMDPMQIEGHGDRDAAEFDKIVDAEIVDD
jgi:hypothetical protein